MCNAVGVIRRIWRYRPFIVAGAAVVIIVRGNTGVTVPEVRSFAPLPAEASAAAVPAAAVRVDGGPTLVAVGPSRLVDSSAAGPIGPGAAWSIDVLGRFGVPADGVDAVVLSVTVTDPTMPTFLSIGPAGGLAVQRVDAAAATKTSAVVMTELGPDGSIAVANAAGEAALAIDVAAYVLSP